MRDPRTCVLDRPHFTFVNMDAVGCDHLRVEDTAFLEEWYYRHAVFLTDVFHLSSGLCDVNMQRDIIFHRQIGASPQDLIRAGVGCVGADGGHDQRVSLPMLDEFLGVL